MTSAQSILVHFLRRAASLDAAPAIWKNAGSGFESICWGELKDAVLRAASAYHRLGVRPGSPVVHVSENRWEWIVTDLALQVLRAVHVPAHAPLSGAQIAWQIDDTDARLAVLSDQIQLDKLSEQTLRAAPQLVLYEDARSDSLPCLAWPRLLEESDREEGERLLQAAISSVRSNQLASILYTSGTTGEPKGVMLSHGNLCSNAEAACEVFAQDPSHKRLSFLPMSHIFARTCDLYCSIVGGSQLALATSRESVIPDCQTLHPTHLNGVPYFFQKVQQAVCDAGMSDQVGALQATFGGSMQFLCSGGAALPVNVFDFYLHQGLPILQGYGLSETSPIISASTNADNRRGACGIAVPGVDVSVAEDGEIITRGPHVMLGYYKDQKATDELIRDGWLYTGDLGSVDADGFVFITGRKKEIIVTSSGKSISPIQIEQQLTSRSVIAQALVVGDDRPFLTALVVADLDALASELDSDLDELRSLIASSGSDSRAHQHVRRHIELALADLSHHEQVRSFVLLCDPFSLDRGELTPKLSIRRNVVVQHHQAAIEALYE